MTSAPYGRSSPAATPWRSKPARPGVTRGDARRQRHADDAIAHLAVTVDLEHAWHGDLALSLLSPDGTRVVLVRPRDGRSSDLRRKVFDAVAPIAVADAAPPFDGRFRPHGDLADLRACGVDGDWTLAVQDGGFHDVRRDPLLGP